MISHRCKYAIKALIYIAKQNNDNRMVFSSEIAEKEHIPKKFLESILRDLKNAQILNSKRGADGGYALNKDPKDINLVEVIRIMDGPIALLPCVSLKYYQKCETCNNENTCAIRKVFGEVRDKTLEIYEKNSIQSMIE